MNHVEIKRLREICDKATEGPWEAVGRVVSADGSTLAATGANRYSAEAAANAEFIAASRSALPVLLDLIEALPWRVLRFWNGGGDAPWWREIEAFAPPPDEIDQQLQAMEDLPPEISQAVDRNFKQLFGAD